MKTQLPTAAVARFGRLAGFDWETAKEVPMKLKGLLYGTIIHFATPNAFLYVSGFNVDSDGPGGSKKVDPCWQKDTSLRTSGGSSLDSRKFPGVVIPPELFAMGVRLSDFGVIFWRSAPVAMQAYDMGPAHKIGEGSLFTGRKLNAIPYDMSDHNASTKGIDCNDVVTVFFPRSGPGHSLAPELIPDTVRRILLKNGIAGIL